MHWTSGEECSLQDPTPTTIATIFLVAISGPAFINWFYGMEHATRCVKPGKGYLIILYMHYTIIPVTGTTVTWLWGTEGHNVNIITAEEYNKCNVSNPKPHNGDYVWTAPAEINGTSEDFYFACGMYSGNPGYHCKHGGMKAVVEVSHVHC